MFFQQIQELHRQSCKSHAAWRNLVRETWTPARSASSVSLVPRCCGSRGALKVCHDQCFVLSKSFESITSDAHRLQCPCPCVGIFHAVHVSFTEQEGNIVRHSASCQLIELRERHEKIISCFVE